MISLKCNLCSKFIDKDTLAYVRTIEDKFMTKDGEIRPMHKREFIVCILCGDKT